MSAAVRHWEGNQLIAIAVRILTPMVLVGAFVAPATPLAAAPAAAAPAGSPHPLIAPFDPGAGPVAGPSTPIDQLHGIAFLDRLGALPRGDIRSYLASHPGTVTGLLASPPMAAEVADWWSATPASSRTALSDAAPRLVGNLEGVPVAVRDLANRVTLAGAIAKLDARLAGHVGRAERDELDARRHMLGQITLALRSSDGHPRRLVGLDASGEGQAVIAVGDLARADFVSYLVPGMFFGVDAQIDAWADTAESYVDDQERWLARLHPDAHETVAAVAWIGYRTPSLVNVASMELAREGRDALTASLQGLRASRGDRQPYLSVLAHSYGSTAALLALAENDVSVDALALVGSPGSPARNVRELHVADGNVWVGAASWDPIPVSGVFGSQPTSAAYGAHRFSVAAGRDPLTGAKLGGAVTHNDYFSAGSSSLRNLALIGIDEGGYVTGVAAGDAPVTVRKLAR